MASSIQEALYDYIPTKISGIRLYWNYVSDGKTITRPYVTMSTVGSDGSPKNIGEYNEVALIQFSVWSEGATGLALANSLVSTLSQLSGTVGGYRISLITTSGPIEIKDPDFNQMMQFVVDAEVDYSRGAA